MEVLERLKFPHLFFTVLSLFHYSIIDVSFSMEPSIIDAVDNSILQENQTDFFFRSTDVLWRVDRHTGTISTFDPDKLLPLWSSSGVVYRTSSPEFRLDDQDSFNKPFPQNVPEFDKHIDCTEILGRIYFHLSEKRRTVKEPFDPNKSSDSAAYTDQILAFDSTSQGKLLWKLNAKELKQILQTSSTSVPRFACTPRKGKANLLIVVLILDAQTISLNVDASSGVLVFE